MNPVRSRHCVVELTTYKSLEKSGKAVVSDETKPGNLP